MTWFRLKFECRAACRDVCMCVCVCLFVCLYVSFPRPPLSEEAKVGVLRFEGRVSHSRSSSGSGLRNSSRMFARIPASVLRSSLFGSWWWRE